MNLPIRALLKSTLISSEQISTDCNIRYDDVTKLTAETLSFNDVSNIIPKKLYNYYKLHKKTLLPMHTYLLIQQKFDVYNRDADVIFLDFFETTELAANTVGREQFKSLIGKNLDEQKTPFFLLENSDTYFVYHIEEFEDLINDLSIIKPTGSF